MATPDWIKTLPPEALARKKRGMTRRAYMPERGGSAIPSAPMPSNPAQGASLYTGAGADGVVQPLNRVGATPGGKAYDEGEMVLTAQDTRAVGSLVEGLVNTSRMGQLTPEKTNQIRLAIGLQPEQRYAGGTIDPFTNAALAPVKADIAANKMVNAASGIVNQNMGNFSQGTATPTTTQQPGALNINTGAGATVLPNFSQGSTQQPGALNTNTNIGSMPGVNRITLPVQQQPAGSAVNTISAGLQPSEIAPAAAAQTGQLPSTYQRYSNLAAGMLADTARGENPYFRTAANRALQEQDLRAAAQEGALRQSQAQRGLTGGIAATESAAQRIGAEGQRSELAGQLAESAQEKSLQAQGQLATVAEQGINREQNQAWKEYDALIAAGDYDGSAQR